MTDSIKALAGFAASPTISAAPLMAAAWLGNPWVWGYNTWKAAAMKRERSQPGYVAPVINYADCTITDSWEALFVEGGKYHGKN